MVNKVYILVREKTWLPIKYWLQRKKNARQIIIPSGMSILKKKEEVEREVLDAEREENEKKLAVAKGRRRLMNWYLQHNK